MGQCQSVNETERVTASKSSGKLSFQTPNPSKRRRSRAFMDRVKSSRKSSTPNGSGPVSPSEHTAGTRPVSPDSMASPSSLSALTPEHVEEEEGDDEDDQDPTTGVTLLNFVPSLRHTEELAAVIPEEIDPDAPSDEEEQHQHVEASARRSKRLEWDEEPGPLNPRGSRTDARRVSKSPTRTKKRKGRMMRSRHVQKRQGPNSIVHHDDPPPLIAPPPGQELPLADGPPSPGSVDRQTIAQFNRLRVQAKMAAQQQRKNRRSSKLEDRYSDVQEYRKLWERFQELQKTAPPTPKGGKLKRSNSFNLKDTRTWFFDFQNAQFEGDDDDERSQSSRMSLLSEKGREAQKRIFEEKRRIRRSNSEPCLWNASSFMGSPATDSSKEEVANVVHSIKVASPVDRDDRSEEVEGGDDEQSVSTPDYSTWNYVDEKNDYGVKTSLEVVDPNSLTPKRRTHAEDRSVTSLADLDADNDYHVPRRRRQPSRDFSEPSTLQERDAEILGIVLQPPPQDASDYIDDDDLSTTSSLSEIVTLRLPSFDTIDSEGADPLWRTFSDVRERVVHGNADRLVEDVRNNTSSVGVLHKLSLSKSPVKQNISNMSTQEFLRIADDHALTQVARTRELASNMTDCTGLEAGPSSSDQDDKSNVVRRETDLREVLDVNGFDVPKTTGGSSDKSIPACGRDVSAIAADESSSVNREYGDEGGRAVVPREDTASGDEEVTARRSAIDSENTASDTVEECEKHDGATFKGQASRKDDVIAGTVVDQVNDLVKKFRNDSLSPTSEHIDRTVNAETSRGACSLFVSDIVATTSRGDNSTPAVSDALGERARLDVLTNEGTQQYLKNGPDLSAPALNETGSSSDEGTLADFIGDEVSELIIRFRSDRPIYTDDDKNRNVDTITATSGQSTQDSCPDSTGDVLQALSTTERDGVASACTGLEFPGRVSSFEVPEDEIATDRGLSMRVMSRSFQDCEMDDAPLDELASLVRSLEK